MCHPRYLRGWEIIIVTVCHDSNPICKTNSGKAASSPNKHSFLWLETRVASLGLGKSPLRPGSKVVGPLVDTKKIQDRSICFFQIWRACSGCGSPWKVSKGSSNTGAACNQHKQKNKFWRLWQPGLNDERSRCLTAPLWPYAASTPAMHYASVVTKTAAMIRFN